MRILMVGGRYQAMMDDAIYGLNASAIEQKISVGYPQFKLKDGSEIWVIQVQNSLDLEKLRGLRFDFVIEHPSFPRDARLHQELRAYTNR